AAFGRAGGGLPRAGQAGPVRLWDLAPCAPLPPSLYPRRANSFHPPSLSPNGSRVVTWGDRRVRVWDATTAAPVTPWLEHDTAVGHAAFSPAGRHLANPTALPAVDPLP